VFECYLFFKPFTLHHLSSYSPTDSVRQYKPFPTAYTHAVFPRESPSESLPAAIKSLLHFAVREDPESMLQNECIQAIRPKKTDHKPPPSLTAEQVRAILESIDTAKPLGLRDKALIQLLDNTGARVQETADLNLCDLHLDKAATITLTGKGRKTRAVPPWSETVDMIQGYLNNANTQASNPSTSFSTTKTNPSPVLESGDGWSYTQTTPQKNAQA